MCQQSISTGEDHLHPNNYNKPILTQQGQTYPKKSSNYKVNVQYFSGGFNDKFYLYLDAKARKGFKEKIA